MRKIVITLSIVFILAISACNSEVVEEDIFDSFPYELNGNWTYSGAIIAEVKTYSIGNTSITATYGDASTTGYRFLEGYGPFKSNLSGETWTSWHFSVIALTGKDAGKGDTIVFHINGNRLRVNDEANVYARS